jgi:hypothetical protein
MASNTSAAGESNAELQAKQAPAVAAPVVRLLRLEGLALAAISAVLYARIGSSWWLFAALWLVPDLSMLGYLVSPCWGARCYNAIHSTITPITLALAALLLHTAGPLPYALIWLNHIGVDRLWLDASWQARKTAGRIYSCAFVSCLTRDVSACTTNEAPSPISRALTIDR